MLTDKPDSLNPCTCPPRKPGSIVPCTYNNRVPHCCACGGELTTPDELSRSVAKQQEALAEAKKAFVFVCEKDRRLATPDYAKYKAAYTAFRIAEDALLLITDYEEAMKDKRCLVRELDVALNGDDGAAPQASLCDIVHQVKAMKRESGDAWEDTPDFWTGDIAKAHPTVTGDHDTYEMSLEMVSNRHSKGSLVDLVNWLNWRINQLHKAMGLDKDMEELGNALCDLPVGTLSDDDADEQGRRG